MILLMYTYTFICILCYGQEQAVCDYITTCEDCVNSAPDNGCRWILSEQDYFPSCDNYESNQSKYRYKWASSESDCPTIFDSIAFQAIVPSVAAVLCICCVMFIMIKCRKKNKHHTHMSQQEPAVIVASQQAVYMVPQGQVMLVQAANQPPQYVAVQPVNILSSNAQSSSQNK